MPLSLKVFEDTANESTEISVFDHPSPLIGYIPQQEISSNFWLNLILLETTVSLGYIHAADSVSLSSFKLTW